MLPAGTVLANRYRLDDKLGEGSAAVVYRGEDLRLGRAVAVKVLRPAFIADPEQAARFEHEARAAAGLSAPNVVDVYDYGHDADTAFIVMQYIDGQDLKHTIGQQGRLAPEEAARIAAAVCHGLEAAHERGLIHRDVKPQNILIDRHGQVRLTDFGIAKALGGPGLTQAGMTYGTAAYLSPEQATGQPIGPPADIYALGIVLYEMLCGQPPFVGDNVAAIAYQQVYEAPPPLRGRVPTVPAELEAIVNRALQKDSAARFPDAAAMAAALDAFLRTRASAAPVATAVPVAPGAGQVSEPPPWEVVAPAGAAPFTPSASPAPGYQPTAAYAPTPSPVAAWDGAAAAHQPQRSRMGLLWLLVPLALLLLFGGLFAGGVLRFNTGAPPATPVGGGGVAGTPTAAPTGAVPGGALTATAVAAIPPAPTDTPPAPAPPTQAPPAPTTPPVRPTASPVPQAPPGTKGRPIFTTPTPPTGTDRRVALEDVAFSGGYRYPPPSVYNGRTAIWVYGQGTEFASMSAPFLLTAQPTGNARLVLAGMDSEDRAKTPLRVLINGQVIYNGANPLPNAGTWGTATFTFPAGLLHPGDNTLTVENLSPSGNLGIPFIMIDAAQITWDGE